MNKKRKIIYISLILVIVIIGVGVFVWLQFFKDKDKFTIKHQVVENLYSNVDTTTCNYVNEDKMGENTILYLIFSKLKNDKKLQDTISTTEYTKAGREILYKDVVIPKEFTAYEYDGYTYTMNGDNITRTKGVCSDKQYITKMYGYSYNEKEIEVNIKVAYKKGNKVYDLNDKELGDYKKDTINTLMDSSNSKIYTYNIEGNNYYLKDVSS